MAFADASGARLHYEVTGSGTPIVFCHETASDLRSWEAQVRCFSRSHKCITFDARGIRSSDMGPDPTRNDHRQFSEDIGSVMDAAGVDKAFVVGLSMGAYFTAHFAVNHPDRLLGIVLAGLGTGSAAPQAFHDDSVRVAREVRKQGIEHLVRLLALAANRVQLHIKNPRAWEAWIQELREHSADGTANIMEYCHAQRPPIYTLQAQLRALKVPTLVAVGDEDAGCLEPSLFLKHTIPSAGLWVCPRTGHAINLEEPVLFNATLQSFIHDVQQGTWGERDPRTLGSGPFAALAGELPGR